MIAFPETEKALPTDMLAYVDKSSNVILPVNVKSCGKSTVIVPEDVIGLPVTTNELLVTLTLETVAEPGNEVIVMSPLLPVN
jgi:hypothetical protein